MVDVKRGRQVVTLTCADFTISCAGDAEYRRLLSKLVETLKIPMNALVSDALKASYGDELDDLRSRPENQALSFKELLELLSRTDGTAIGTLVREAIDTTYAEQLAALRSGG